MNEARRETHPVSTGLCYQETKALWAFDSPRNMEKKSNRPATSSYPNRQMMEQSKKRAKQKNPTSLFYGCQRFWDNIYIFDEKSSA